LVRSGKVAAPQQRRFNIEGWNQAFKGIANADGADHCLYEAGVWFDQVFTEIRLELEKTNLGTIPPRYRISTVIAFGTRDLFIMRQRVRERYGRRLKNKETMWLNRIAEETLQLESGIEVRPDDIITGVVDQAPYMIDTALQDANTKPANSFETAQEDWLLRLGG
jgi:hypothetical protein